MPIYTDDDGVLVAEFGHGDVLMCQAGRNGVPEELVFAPNHGLPAVGAPVPYARLRLRFKEPDAITPLVNALLVLQGKERLPEPSNN